MTQGVVRRQSLDELSFLIGDWRGNGILDYPGPPVKRSNYEIAAMCKRSPDNQQLMLVTFNEDREHDSMFHATQAFIYVDRDTGQLRIKRHWLMDTDNEGFVTVEKVTPDENTKSFGFTVVEREGVPQNFQHDGKVDLVNDSELVITGEVTIQDRKYPYVDKYKRRANSRP
jgi:hypothetical protein